MSPASHPGPELQTAPVVDLESRANRRTNGKPRKPPVHLADCELLQLVQYRCEVEEPTGGGGGSSSSSSSAGSSQAGSDNESDGVTQRRSERPAEGEGSSRDAASSGGKRPVIVCTPFARYFRRCAGGLTVETTKWEWWNAEEELDRRIKQEADSREGG